MAPNGDPVHAKGPIQSQLRPIQGPRQKHWPCVCGLARPRVCACAAAVAAAGSRLLWRLRYEHAGPLLTQPGHRNEREERRRKRKGRLTLARRGQSPVSPPGAPSSFPRDRRATKPSPGPRAVWACMCVHFDGVCKLCGTDPLLGWLPQRKPSLARLNTIRAAMCFFPCRRLRCCGRRPRRRRLPSNPSNNNHGY